jgi:4-diphosphocytidyl-2C-methyl-D-erythritol kinase
VNQTKDNAYLIKQKYSELLDSKLNETNINNNVINDLNNKITTFGQAIKMNNYETGINNKILLILTGIGAFVVLIFIVVLVYFNNLTAGKIKIFGR